MINIDCNHMNHRHGMFSKNLSARNFRTHDIPYYSIFGIHGMSKIFQPLGSFQFQWLRTCMGIQKSGFLKNLA